MTKQLFENLYKVNQYLLDRTSLLEKAFDLLVTKIKNSPCDLALLHLTYENIESGTKLKSGWKYNKHFNGILSNYELDDICNLKCDNNDIYEDFIWTKNIDLRYFLIESWLIGCVKNLKLKVDITIPIYFKRNVDSMDILNLITGKYMLERVEFERYCSNGKINCIDVFTEH